MEKDIHRSRLKGNREIDVTKTRSRYSRARRISTVAGKKLISRVRSREEIVTRIDKISPYFILECSIIEAIVEYTGLSLVVSCYDRKLETRDRAFGTVLLDRLS